MRPFEEYVEREARAAMQRDTSRQLDAYWSKRARELHRETLESKVKLWITVVIWAVFIVGVLLFGPKPSVETPVESVRSTGTGTITVEPVPAMVLTLDAPCLDAEAREPESPFYREDIPLDYETQELLYEACGETGIRYELMLGLIEVETSFLNSIGDGGESFGYCQIQPKWWSGLMDDIDATDLMNPEDNFRTACHILTELLSTYGDLEDALTAYNSGHPGPSDYATRVLTGAKKWEERT